MQTLLSEIRRAIRGLVSQPAFTIAAVLTLAIGIGATTAIYGIVDGVVLRPLAFPDADRLITICEQYPGSTRDWCSISPPNVEDIAARSRAIDAIGIGRNWEYHLATVDGAEAIEAGLITPGLFAALGAHAALGRLFVASDLVKRESDVVVLSYEMWMRRFGGTPDVIDRRIVLDGHAVTIVGVTPPGFELPKFRNVDLWRPVHFDPSSETNREWRGFVAYGRLRHSVSLDAARTELASIEAELRRERFATTPGWGLTEESLQDLVVGDTKPVLLVFLGAVSFILLIGCANVANLLLARAGARTREAALRSALGATRLRLVATALIESLVLALLGMMLGIVLAFLGTRAFTTLAPPGMPRLDEVRVDAGVLVFALVLSLATTLVFGLVPAIRVVRHDVSLALRDGGRGVTGGSGIFGRALVVFELALALVLTIGAGLLVRSFAARTAWSPGFEQEHLLTFTLSLPASSYSGGARVAQAWDRIESELRSVPGVVDVATASGGPLFGGDGADQVAFRDAGVTQRRPAYWYDAGPSYFATFGIPVVQGRAFTPSDRADASHVIVVNETLAREFWPNDSPLEKQVALFSGEEHARVVGVVRDVSPATPGEAVKPQFFVANRQLPRPFTYVIVRTSVPPASISAEVRARLRAIDRNLRAGTMLTFPERRQMELRTPRFQTLLIVTFGCAALLLAAIGTYGMFTYRVSRRTREMGIRLALGAARGRVVAEILRESLSLATFGVAVGIAGAIAAGRAMSGMIAGVSPYDLPTMLTSVCVLTSVAAAACLGPAWRASHVDPAITLTAE